MKRGRRKWSLKQFEEEGKKKSIEIWPKARKFAEKIVESFHILNTTHFLSRN